MKNDRRRLARSEALLFATPLAAVALALGVSWARQIPQDLGQARLKPLACAVMIYQPDGTTRPCGSDHGQVRRTRWEMFVQSVKNKLSSR